MESTNRLENQVIYIGAENIISPLGNTAEENFINIQSGNSAIKEYQNLFDSNQKTICSYIDSFDKIEGMSKLESLMVHSIQQILAKIKRKKITTNGY